MKKLFYGTLFLALIGIGIVGCKKEIIQNSNESAINQNSNSDNLEKSLSINIGELHNQVMSDVHECLMENSNKNDNHILNQAEKTIKNSVIRYFNISNVEYVKFLNEIGLNKKISKDFNIHDFLATKKNEAIIDIEKKDKDLAYDLNNYVENTVNLEREQFINESDKLKLKYQNSPHYELILATTSIGVSSFIYWEENVFDWKKSSSEKISPQAKAIIKADINGAIIGGTWGAVAGSFAGGVGALPGALVGSGISSSFGSAATGIWSYFGW